MTLREFLRHFMFHATLAAVLWLIAALTIERIVPGVVAPFVNLPFVALVVGSSLALLAGSASTSSALGRAMSAFCTCIVVIIAGLFVWTRINDYGMDGVILAVSAGVLAGLTIFALTVESR